MDNILNNKSTKISLKGSLLIISKFTKSGIISFADSSYAPFVLSLFYFIAVFISALLFHKIGNYGVETDFFWAYVPEAKSFNNGSLMIDPFRGPLYPIILAIINHLFSDYFISGIFVAVVSASCTIFVIFHLIKRLFNNLLALFTSFLLIFNPSFILFSYSPGTDLFFMALSVASIYFFLSPRKFEPGRFIFASLFTALACLTRYNGIFLFSAPVALILFNYWDLKLSSRILYAFFFILLIFLFFLPWSIYLFNHTGNFLYNQNSKNILYEFFKKDNTAYEQFWFTSSNSISLTNAILTHPLQFIAHFLKNIFAHFTSDFKSLIGWHIVPFFIIGFLSFFTGSVKDPKQKSYLFISFPFSFYYVWFHILRDFLFYSFPFIISLLLVYSSFLRITFRFSQITSSLTPSRWF